MYSSIEFHATVEIYFREAYIIAGIRVTRSQRSVHVDLDSRWLMRQQVISACIRATQLVETS